MTKVRHEHARNAEKKPLLTPLVRALKEAFAKVSHRRPAHPPRHHVAAAKAIRVEALEPRVLLSADINPAQTVTGSIDAPGETDQFNFTLSTDAKVVFDSLTNAANLNWSLSGPQGAV